MKRSEFLVKLGLGVILGPAVIGSALARKPETYEILGLYDIYDVGDIIYINDNPLSFIVIKAENDILYIREQQPTMSIRYE